MSIAPQHDWAAYEALVAKDEAACLRTLGTDERFAIYADLFRVVWTARQGLVAQGWQKLDLWHWQQKLATRLRCVQAYQKLDDIRNGRAPATNTR
jgi:hypothetical protein